MVCVLDQRPLHFIFNSWVQQQSCVSSKNLPHDKNKEVVERREFWKIIIQTNKQQNIKSVEINSRIYFSCTIGKSDAEVTIQNSF